MRDTYSLYEAKAKFSALIRQVREGRTVTITYRGEPVAELRPSEGPADDVKVRIAAMVKRGTLVPAKDPRAPIKVGPRRRGALKRFLDSRD